MKQKLLTFFLLLGIMFFSCKKSNTGPQFTTNAKVIYTGSIAGDGCGWLVEVDSVKHEEWPANNLSNDYLINNLKVNITYHKLFGPPQGCGMIPITSYAPNAQNGIYIDAISKR